jgi:thiopeptide-type bacteriocin biosynthesis protein
MKNYKFSTHVLARMPLLEVSEKNPVDVLQRKDFKAALFLASRSLYNELSKRDFDYTRLSDKQKQTIKKYLNRARFRSTPFGLFASVTLINWGDASEIFELGEPVANIQPDFRILYELWKKQLEKKADKTHVYQTNASLYINSVDYRYFKKLVDGNCISFSMVSVEKDLLLKSLLQFCKTSKTWEEIRFFLTEKNIPVDTAEDFIRDLIREQILVSGFSPNITGPGYHSVLANFQPSNPAIAIGGQMAKTIPASQVLQHILSASHRMDQYLNKSDDTNYFYCIGERKLIRGSLNQQYQKSIEEGLHCLTKLSQPFINTDLQSFATAFEKKYESEEIPLLEALDPQFGIGYGGLDKIKANYGFLSTGYDAEHNQTNTGPQQNGLASWLINELHMSFNYSRELEITDQQLQRLGKPDAAENPAPSLSVVFRTLDDKVVIESAGGGSALSLIGRFCVFDDVYHHAQLIAKEEQLQNKNVVFAEIAHLCNLHTANINRRPHFYNYEIPVLTGSVLPENKQIQLSDLLVSVREGQVCLRSKKLKKRIVPRLSSAFNYSRNDLPVFRFLCDLQGQGIDAYLNFSLASIVPGLPFYPRVTYKSCILQLAEWHLDVTELRKVQSSEDPFIAFHRLADSLKLPNYFSYCVGDNFLVLNRDQEEDIHLFLKEVEQQKAVTLKEFPFICLTKTETCGGQKLFPQYIASMILQKEVYHHRQVFMSQRQLKTQTNDWVYYKLYCHPLSSDIILRYHLFPLIEKLKKDNLVKSWFWVRYNDPEYHLRIRVRVRPKAKPKVIQLFSVCLEKLCSGKLASHFQTDRYKRELERYSPQLIGKVEDVFRASSEWVAAYINQQNELNYEDPVVMLYAVVSGAVILNAFSIRDQAGLCKKAFAGFFAEFNAPKDLKTEMEKLYRQLEKEIDGILYAGTKKQQFESLIQSINNLVEAHHNSNVKEVSLEKLALDIIHMHLNRLFIYNQRYFEMIHYYLLQRALYKQLYKAN